VHRWDEGRFILTISDCVSEGSPQRILPKMLRIWFAPYCCWCALACTGKITKVILFTIQYAKPPQGIEASEFDHFHELIFIDELSRCGSGGVLWGLSGGLAIGLPPVLKVGSCENISLIAISLEPRILGNALYLTVCLARK
jgi:hypothetical protein